MAFAYSNALIRLIYEGSLPVCTDDICSLHIFSILSLFVIFKKNKKPENNKKHSYILLTQRNKVLIVKNEELHKNEKQSCVPLLLLLFYCSLNIGLRTFSTLL